MNLKKAMFLFIIVFSATSFRSQTSCSLDKILGEWIFVKSKSTNSINLIVDTVQTFADTANYSKRTTTYLADGTLKYVNKGRIKTKTYKLDEQDCKISVGKTPSRTDIATIIYLDKKHLIFTQPSSHGEFTYYYRKK